MALAASPALPPAGSAAAASSPSTVDSPSSGRPHPSPSRCFTSVDLYSFLGHARLLRLYPVLIRLGLSSLRLLQRAAQREVMDAAGMTPTEQMRFKAQIDCLRTDREHGEDQPSTKGSRHQQQEEAEVQEHRWSPHPLANLEAKYDTPPLPPIIYCRSPKPPPSPPPHAAVALPLSEAKEQPQAHLTSPSPSPLRRRATTPHVSTSDPSEGHFKLPQAPRGRAARDQERLQRRLQQLTVPIVAAADATPSASASSLPSHYESFSLRPATPPATPSFHSWYVTTCPRCLASNFPSSWSCISCGRELRVERTTNDERKQQPYQQQQQHQQHRAPHVPSPSTSTPSPPRHLSALTTRDLRALEAELEELGLGIAGRSHGSPSSAASAAAAGGGVWTSAERRPYTAPVASSFSSSMLHGEQPLTQEIVDRELAHSAQATSHLSGRARLEAATRGEPNAAWAEAEAKHAPPPGSSLVAAAAPPPAGVGGGAVSAGRVRVKVDVATPRGASPAAVEISVRRRASTKKKANSPATADQPQLHQQRKSQQQKQQPEQQRLHPYQRRQAYDDQLKAKQLESRQKQGKRKLSGPDASAQQSKEKRARAAEPGRR